MIPGNARVLGADTRMGTEVMGEGHVDRHKREGSGLVMVLLMVHRGKEVLLLLMRILLGGLEGALLW